MTGDDSKYRPDVPFKPTGVGMDHRRNCMGCNVWRSTAGGRGAGLRWRCAVCQSERAAEKEPA